MPEAGEEIEKHTFGSFDAFETGMRPAFQAYPQMMGQLGICLN